MSCVENLTAPSLAEFDHFKKTIDLSATAEDHNEVRREDFQGGQDQCNTYCLLILFYTVKKSGNAPDFTMRPGGKNLPLIRRFNRHAMRVLDVPR